MIQKEDPNNSKMYYYSHKNQVIMESLTLLQSLYLSLIT